MSLTVCNGRRNARWDIDGTTTREHAEVAHVDDECPVCAALDLAAEQSDRADGLASERDQERERAEARSAELESSNSGDTP